MEGQNHTTNSDEIVKRKLDTRNKELEIEEIRLNHKYNLSKQGLMSGSVGVGFAFFTVLFLIAAAYYKAPVSQPVFSGWHIVAIIFILVAGLVLYFSLVFWREVKLAAETKTLVASLGDVAASGGYYIVCPADTIIASENTITGSIGVFGLLPNMKELMNEKLGITSDVVRTNDKSDMGSVFRPLTEDERELIQKSVDGTYNTFVTHVAEGRGKSYEDIDAIGQGRVWSGKDAMAIGLIDMFGGLDKSIEVAAEIAGLENYRVTSMPKIEDPMTQLMKQLSGDARTSALERELGSYYKYFEMARDIEEMKGVQARMPYLIEVK